MLSVNKHVHIVYIEICGNLSLKVGVVKKISVSLNSEKFRAYKRCGTVLAVKGVPMGNSIVNINRNATNREM